MCSYNLEVFALEKEIIKHIGKTIEIIYVGADGQITQRLIEVRSVNKDFVKALCLQRKAPRVFRLDNILAIQPAAGRVTA
jgi:predicted DNA-binding transcriptional regulator YafY